MDSKDERYGMNKLTREELMRSATLAAQTSSAVEGIYRPFDGKRLLQCEDAPSRPLRFPRTGNKS